MDVDLFISVRQPFAGLLALGDTRLRNAAGGHYKTHEVRTSRFPEKHLGSWVAIHAAGQDHEALADVTRALDGPPVSPAWTHLFSARKAVVAVGRVVACERVYSCVDDLQRAVSPLLDAESGRHLMSLVRATVPLWGWQFAEVRALPMPVGMSGALGVQPLPEYVRDRLRSMLANDSALEAQAAGAAYLPPGQPETPESSGVRILTYGYQRWRRDGVLDDMRTRGVDVLVDVRRSANVPNPDWQEEPLREACRAAGLRYWSANHLGNPRFHDDIAAMRAAQSTGGMEAAVRRMAARYRSHILNSDLVAPAVATLLRSGCRTWALLCACEDAAACHRSVLAEEMNVRLVVDGRGTASIFHVPTPAGFAGAQGRLL